ncbi:MAG: A/G-specific adenine glycosylase [Gaiellaceae bacterium]
MDGLLLAWFEESARDLPWRHTRDPYAILVSEVMLQQTQVERVVPHYLAWLGRWPMVEALAAARRADVIRAWQGLGYNRRALSLHQAAQRVAEHGWPDDLTELPGVGRYTADAVAAFAFGAPVLPEDTNVGRVQERTGHTFAPECAQALMDLGATVCLPGAPLRSLPVGSSLPFARQTLRADAPTRAVRRLVPGAAGACAAGGRSRAARRRRARRRGSGRTRARRAGCRRRWIRSPTGYRLSLL